VTVHAIRITGDPVLHLPTREITEFDAGLRTLTEDMFETMYAAEGVGLAANQIGLDLRVFVYDCPDDEGTHHKGIVVNPKLETSEVPETMPDPDDDWEGCLSAPGESYPTGRATWAKVTGVDVEGNPIEVEGTGYFARCLQHETDHLHGVLYIDKLPRNRRRRVLRDMTPFEWNAS
jgi:peptide deformylase